MKKIYYNRENTCDNIKDDDKKCENKLRSGNANREYDKKGNWTGRWLCKNCYSKNYQKNNPNSTNNIMKSIRNSRTDNLDISTNKAKGDLFEELTCRWRGVKRLSIENDNYRLSIDHSPDPELGIIQTKGALYNSTEKRWHNGGIGCEHNKEFDYLIFYCADKNGKIIERIYIFPKDEVLKRLSISIVKTPTKIRYVEQWYEKYRIDEKNVKYVNELFRRISI